jgi:hypothetical protein
MSELVGVDLGGAKVADADMFLSILNAARS